jgi:UDP-N-acetylglucosamine 2-epimerase
MALKLEKMAPKELLTEEAIMRSSLFKAVIEEARGLQEEASKCEELRQKLHERTQQLDRVQREKQEAVEKQKQSQFNYITAQSELRKKYEECQQQLVSIQRKGGTEEMI